MKKRTISSLELYPATWPAGLGWCLYGLSVLVVMMLPVGLLIKLTLLAGVSVYILWWQRRFQACRYRRLRLVSQESHWLLTQSNNEDIEAELKTTSRFSWGVILHFRTKGNDYCSLLVTRGTVSNDTFRQLQVYLNYELSG